MHEKHMLYYYWVIQLPLCWSCCTIIELSEQHYIDVDECSNDQVIMFVVIGNNVGSALLKMDSYYNQIVEHAK